MRRLSRCYCIGAHREEEGVDWLMCGGCWLNPPAVCWLLLTYQAIAIQLSETVLGHIVLLVQIYAVIFIPKLIKDVRTAAAEMVWPWPSRKPGGVRG